MALEHVGYVDLPPHAKPGGFDHVAVHSGRGLLLRPRRRGHAGDPGRDRLRHQPREERRLKDSKYRNEIARAILAGLAEYKRAWDQRARAAAEPPSMTRAR